MATILPHAAVALPLRPGSRSLKVPGMARTLCGVLSGTTRPTGHITSLPMARTRIPALLALGLAVSGPAAAQELQPLMGEPVSGLTAAEMNLFIQGLAAFSAPLSEADGLGPIFNEVSCGACHNIPAIGGHGSRQVTRFGVAANRTVGRAQLEDGFAAFLRHGKEAAIRGKGCQGIGVIFLFL